MLQRTIATLGATLCGHVDLGKSRLETLCLVVVGMVGARTVNLGHIATECPGDALTAATYRRLQRFFQHVRLRTGRCRSSRRCSGCRARGIWRSTERSGRSAGAR